MSPRPPSLCASVVDVGSMLRQWWSAPVDHHWLRAFLETRSLTTVVRVVIAVFAGSLTFSVLVMTGSPAGPRGVVGTVAVIACALLGVFWFVRWVITPWPSVAMSGLFVLSADLAIASVSALDADPMTGLAGVLMLLVPGLYLTAFHGPRAVVAHSVFAAAVVAIVLTPLVTQPPTDLARAVAKGVMSAAVLVAIPILSHLGWWMLRSEAAESLVDPLTGLCNRRGLRTVFVRTVVGARPGRGDVLLVVVYDLDGFKGVNDRHGHDAGDRVLTAMARRVSDSTPPSVIHARLGGEEFATVGFVDRREVASVADAVRRAIAGGGDPPVTASLGCLVVERDAISVTRVDSQLGEWLRQADAAMYVAKHDGGNAISFA